jgi:hypothetical protein
LRNVRGMMHSGGKMAGPTVRGKQEARAWSKGCHAGHPGGRRGGG